MPFFDEFSVPKLKIKCPSGNEDDQHDGWEADPLQGGVGHQDACMESTLLFLQKYDLKSLIKNNKNHNAFFHIFEEKNIFPFSPPVCGL